MIHVLTKGGLGNQMFEYAYALQLQKALDHQNIVINGIFHRYAIDKRHVSLQYLSIPQKDIILPPLYSLYYLFIFFVRLLSACGFRLFFSFIKHKLHIASEHQSLLHKHGIYCPANIYDVPPIHLAQHKYWHLYGNFQSPTIIAGIENILREHFKVSTPPSPANADLIHQIRSNNSVCLHIRRGDYLLPIYKQLQVCDINYYTKAIQQAKNLLRYPKFYVFSTGHNDIKWIKTHYHFDADIQYVDLDNPDYEEFRLMSLCKHFIISNSTFSWWAAVLSQETAEKRVWCPKTWLKDSSVNMALDSWITL